MSEDLLRRRLVVGPIVAAVAVFGLWAVADAHGWGEAFLPSVVAGVLGSLGIAWYFVTSERRLAGRPAVKVGAGVIVTAGVVAAAVVRSVPEALVYGVVVLTLAMALGFFLSAAHELRRGTYVGTAEAAGDEAGG